MNQQTMRNLTLFDLLARTWDVGAPVRAACFNADGSAAAFACADGGVAVARLADDEPPEGRIRVSADLGQSTIRPREKPVSPLIVTAAMAGGATPLVAAGQSAFLAGSAAHGVARIAMDGDVADAGVDLDGPAVALDRSVASGAIAASAGTGVRIVTGRASPLSIDTGRDPVGALAFSPTGDRLAVGAGAGLSIWSLIPEAGRAARIGLPAAVIGVAWSADGAWLAAWLETGGICLLDPAGTRSAVLSDFPAPVRSLAWSRPANALLAAGAFRVAGWSMATPPLDDPRAGALVTGRAGLVVVESVAAHPQRPLVAAGYASGQIVVSPVGSREELLVKPSGGAVVALRWSADGRHLAAGTQDGKASLITFPAQLFK